MAITVTGQNDAPVALEVIDAVDEDGPVITVSASFSDVDASDTHTFTVDTTGTLGAVTNNGDGTFDYDPNGAFEALAAGETATDTFTYTVDDGRGGASTETVTITVTGQNDAPVALEIADTVHEDGPGITVAASFSDVDASDTHTFSVDTSGILGTVTNNNDGTFDYGPNGAFEALADGETATDTFTYTVDDGNGGTSTENVTITVTGENDAPVALEVVDTVDEDGPGITVSADFTDVDANDAHTFSVDITGTLGSVINNGNGTFDYGPNGAFEALAEGETATDTFTYTVDDGNGGMSTETVTITVTGQNDAPVALEVTDAVDEDGPGITVSANFSDVDASDTHTFTVDTTGTLGAVTNNGDGTFDYDPNGAFEALAEGETATDTFTYTVDDGNGGTSTETVTITVTGQNDAPVALEVTDAVDEDGPGITVSADFSDVDASDTHTFTVDTTGTLGAVTNNGNGTFDYDPNGAFEELAEGETATDTFTYTVDDGNGGTSTETVTITVTGQNDAPNILLASLLSVVNEDDTDGPTEITTGITGDVSDADTSDSVDVSITGVTQSGALAGTLTDAQLLSFATLSGSAGGVTAVASGATAGSYDLTFDASSVPGAFEFLPQGGSLLITYEVTATDSQGATDTMDVSVNVIGRNDAPIAGAPLTGTFTEDDPATFFELLTGSRDPDAGDTIRVASTGPLPAGVTLNGTAVFVDPSHPLFQSLAAGETRDLLINYQIEDDHGASVPQTITLTVVGTNDAPVALAVAGTVSEDGPGITVSANFNDVDTSDTHTFTIDTTGTLGTVINNNDGTFSYDPNGQFEALNPGETATDTFTYTVNDGNGGTSTETVTITINGEADGIFTASADTVNLQTVITTQPETDFAGNFLNALTGDDDVTLIRGNEVSSYIGNFLGQTFDANGGDDRVRIVTDAMNAQGGTGTDTVDFNATFRNVTYDFTTGVANIVAVGTLSATGFENYFGSNASDVVTNGAGANVIDGSTGNDTINIGVGFDSTLDTFIGGIGADDLVNDSGANFGFVDFDFDGVVTDNGTGIEEIFFNGHQLLGTADANHFNLTFVSLDRLDTAATNVNTGGGNDVVFGSGQFATTTTGSSLLNIRYDLGEGNDTFTGAASGSVVDVVDGGIGNDNISGGAANDILMGGAGDDTLLGGASNDDLTGGAGADSIDGGSGNDTIRIVAGDDVVTDTLIGGSGADDIVNDSGADFAFANFDFDGVVSANGSGIEEIFFDGHRMLGTADANHFNLALVSLDRLNTAATNVDTGGGNDVVFGSGQFATTTTGSSLLNIRYDLGEGNDTFTGAASGSVADVVEGGIGNDNIDGGAANDTLSGGMGDDTLIGGASSDDLTGGAGADNINGGSGNDTIRIVAGDDLVTDILIGGSGADDLVNDSGADFMIGDFDFTGAVTQNGTGIDEIFFNGQMLLGTAGDDHQNFGLVSFDRIDDSATNVATGGGNDVVFGSGQFATTTTGASLLSVRYDLGAGNDTFTGDASGSVADVVEGGIGNDNIDGGAANDTLSGGLGDDTLLGGASNDVLTGGAGADSIDGGSGNDTIRITANDNAVTDILIGGSGADDIVNDSAADFAFADFDFDGLMTQNGSGIDEILFDGHMLLGTANANHLNLAEVALDQLNAGATNVATGAGNDVVFGSGDAATTTTGSSLLSVRYDLGEGNDTFTGDAGGSIADVVTGGIGNDNINGGAANDTLSGGLGDDTLLGGASNDDLTGGAGADSIDGGSGNDTIRIVAGDDLVTDVLIGGLGADDLVNDSGADFSIGDFDFTGAITQNGSGIEEIFFNGHTLLGTAGDDSQNFALVALDRLDAAATNVSTGGGNDVVLGSGQAATTTTGASLLSVRYDLGDGNDTFTGSASGSVADVVTGGIGNDSIDGGAANDTLSGGFGDDTLTGGASNDELTGDDGADTFVFADGHGNDTVTDFDLTMDILDLSAVTQITDFNDLINNHLSVSGNDLVISGGGTIRLENIDQTDFETFALTVF
ncbi:MAG: VCBS domain-containing protein [Paracoccaceae bacterium]